jgi:hypothetical protein
MTRLPSDCIDHIESSGGVPAGARLPQRGRAEVDHQIAVALHDGPGTGMPPGARRPYGHRTGVDHQVAVGLHDQFVLAIGGPEVLARSQRAPRHQGVRYRVGRPDRRAGRRIDHQVRVVLHGQVEPRRGVPARARGP